MKVNIYNSDGNIIHKEIEIERIVLNGYADNINSQYSIYLNIAKNDYWIKSDSLTKIVNTFKELEYNMLNLSKILDIYLNKNNNITNIAIRRITITNEYSEKF